MLMAKPRSHFFFAIRFCLFSVQMQYYYRCCLCPLFIAVDVENIDDDFGSVHVLHTSTQYSKQKKNGFISCMCSRHFANSAKLAHGFATSTLLMLLFILIISQTARFPRFFPTCNIYIILWWTSFFVSFSSLLVAEANELATPSDQ